jgi:hypothetical protein
VSEIVRRDNYNPAIAGTRVDRPTMKALVALRGAALIGEAEELVVAKGRDLAQEGMLAAANLDQLGTALSRDKPALELELRGWEQAFGLGGKETLLRYMTRPL